MLSGYVPSWLTGLGFCSKKTLGNYAEYSSRTYAIVKWMVAEKDVLFSINAQKQYLILTPQKTINHSLTSYAACLMNCLAGCLHMAGTVITHLISSFTILVEDWSESSCRQWSLKNRSAWANTNNASIFLPLAAWISTPLWRSWFSNVVHVFERKG